MTTTMTTTDDVDDSDDDDIFYYIWELLDWNGHFMLWYDEQCSSASLSSCSSCIYTSCVYLRVCVRTSQRTQNKFSMNMYFASSIAIECNFENRRLISVLVTRAVIY